MGGRVGVVANKPVEGNCWPQSWVVPLGLQKCPSDDDPASHLLNFTHQSLIKTLRPVSPVIVWINTACLEPNLSYIFLCIFVIKILEWIAIPFSRGSSQPRDRSWVSCIAGRFLPSVCYRGVLKSYYKIHILKIQCMSLSCSLPCFSSTSPDHL